MTTWDRGYIHGAIAEATGVVLNSDHPLIDTLIAQAQAEGLQPAELRTWIYTEMAETAEQIRCSAITAALAAWASKRKQAEGDKQ